jgi:site-specific DNA-cytosine methylase
MQWTNTLVGSRIRRLTPTEVCRLFTIDDNYFHDKNGKRLVSESQQYKALGNGWIVDVIAHIFSFIK